MNLPKSILGLIWIPLLILVSGCKKSTPTQSPDPVPASIEIVSGQDQSAPGGALLDESLVVQVNDQTGTGLAGVNVSWSVEAGNGMISPASGVTGTNGIAQAEWTLGMARDNVVSAHVSGIDPLEFRATGISPCQEPPPVSAPPANAVLPSYTFHQVSQKSWPYPETFPWVADIDIGNDGIPDVFAVSAKLNDTPDQDDPAGAIFVLTNMGFNEWERDSLEIDTTAVNSPVLPIVFDADGDGLDDVLSGQFGLDSKGNTGALDLLLMQRNGTVIEEPSRLNPHDSRATNVYSTTSADLECDGDIDYFSGAVDIAHLYVNDSKGNFTAEDDRTPAGVSGDPPQLNHQGAGFCDVNRDNAPDLMLTATGMEPDMLLINDGFGNFEPAPEGAIPSMPFGTIVREFVLCADYNRDGWNDMVLGESGPDGSSFRYLKNTGDGNFINATNSSEFAAASNIRNPGAPPAPVDLDNDGWTDIVALCDVLMNNNGTFVHYQLDGLVEDPFRCFNDEGLPQISAVIPLVHSTGKVDLFLNSGPPTVLFKQ